MTKSSIARSIITGSFILFLVNSLVEGNRSQTIKEVKALRKMLLEQTSKAQYLEYVKMSNLAWQETVDMFKEQNYRMVIFDAVEFLSFGEEEAMTEMFGEDFMEVSGEFSFRFSDDNIPNDGLAESREICKILTKTLKRIVFDQVKEI